MIAPLPDQIGALQRFERALEALLEAHGEQLGEHGRVTFDRRPGILALLERDDDAGYRPRLMLSADHREPASYGRRIAR